MGAGDGKSNSFWSDTEERNKTIDNNRKSDRKDIKIKCPMV